MSELSPWAEVTVDGSPTVEEFLHAFIDALPGAAWIKRLDGTYIFANDEAVRIFGTTREQLYGVTDFEVFSRETAEQFRTNDALVISTGAPVRAYEFLRQPDGILHESLVTKFPIRDATGLVTFIGGTAIDITDRRRTEAELEARNLEIQAIFQLAPTGLAVAHDPECRFVEANQELQRILGIVGNLTEDTAKLLQVSEDDVLVPVQDLPLRQAARTGLPTEVKRLKVTRIDGSTAHLLTQATPLLRHGVVEGAVAAFVDITDLVQTQRRLEAANAAKDEFLGMVSHELRSPLTSILGLSQLLSRSPDLFQQSERRSISSDIYREALRLTNIVENLLILARFEHGKQIDLEPIIVRRVAAKVLDEVTRISNHRFETRFMPPVISVMGNSVFVEQVIRNLISNAEKYSPEGSLIELVCEVKNGDLVFRVCDRGTGVAESELTQLFEPFYRSPMASSMAGAGIGLSVCKRLVEAMGGKVWAEPREGGGSVFAFSMRPVSI